MQASTAKNKWTVRVPDRNYWREQIKCQEACPVYTDSRGYVRAIAEGNDELAYLIARGPNPLASICGRVCGAPCEAACRRGSLDDPVSIRVLKRYVCDKFSGPSSEHQGRAMIDFLAASAGNYPPRDCSDREELLPLLQALSQGDIQKVSGKSVGIIGSGPAGLACAHDLALFGVDVTLYEMEPELGGMLMFGIPEYRLPRDLIRAEVEVITAMGVKGETNCRVGHDVSFPEIRSRHDFTVIAVGAKRSRKLPIPGADARGVLGGVEFLREVSLGNPHLLEGSVIVIGGGNVAYDVGRTVLRQISVDAARSALRQPETGKVYLCSLESLDEMPADDVEIIEGDEEGIIRKNSMGPREILTNDDGRVRAVRFVRCTRVFDDEGKFSPLFDEDDQTQIECDSVLLSIGQDYDISFIDAERDELAMTDRGMVKCDPVSG